jgi:hypothetical protein
MVGHHILLLIIILPDKAGSKQFHMAIPALGVQLLLGWEILAEPW